MFIKAFILAVRERIDPYREHIDTTSMHRRDESHARRPALAQVYSSSLFTAANRLISPADSGLDLRNWMTRGNHIGPRYDRIQVAFSNGCTKIKLDHVVPRCKGSLRILSIPVVLVANVPHEREHNPITGFLFLTKTI